MRLLTHVLSGLALTSSVPGVMASSVPQQILYFVLGGLASLLPDRLDQSVFSALWKPDLRIVPDPLYPDPKRIAETVAGAIDTTVITGRPIRLRLHPIRLGRNRWLRYRVHIQAREQRVSVRLVDKVNALGYPVADVVEQPAHADAHYSADVAFDFISAVDVACGRGVDYTLMPAFDQAFVRMTFCPWKRRVSHSLLLGGLLAVLAAGVWHVTAGIVIGGAFGLHLILDQLGVMGSRLCWPLRQTRTPGMKLVSGARDMPNAILCWVSLVVVYLNVAQHRAYLLPRFLSPLQFLLVVGLLPTVCAVMRYRVLLTRSHDG